MSSSDYPPDDPTHNLVGKILADRYRIVSLIGEGAMGTVYLGEHMRIGRRDAIKVLRPDVAGDKDAINRFARGARNVSAIRHPNVCTIYDFSNTDDGLQYLAMEFVSGESLKDVLHREGRFEVRRAVAIARQIADALHAAHEAGIVHRDLKPGNVMITPNPDGTDAVKVVDFDIAKGPTETEGDEVTRLGFVVGTPEYMSPEQLMGERLDGRSDVYSLGIVLYRMLTGGLPFRAASTREIMVQRLTVAPLRLDSGLPGTTFPAALQLVIDRALARGRDDRYASAAEFSRDVVAAIDPAIAPVPASFTRPTTAPSGERLIPPTVVAPVPAVALPTPAPQKRMSRAVAGAVAIGLLAAAGVIAATVMISGRDGGVSGGVVSDSTPTTADPPVAPPIDAPAGGNQPAQPQTPGTVTDQGQGQRRQPPGTPTDNDPVTRPLSNPTETSPTFRLPDGVERTLNRQLTLLTRDPAPLTAVQDTAQWAWDLATTRRDSATAAYALTQVFFLRENGALCRTWKQRAAQLGEAAAVQILECK